MKTIKLQQEEIQQIKQFQQKSQQLIQQLGLVEYQIQKLLLEKKHLNDTLKQLIVDEKQLAIQLQDKYGEGSIDLEKEEFIK